MDSAMILVLLLWAAAIALLIWFKINSPQNESRSESESTGKRTLPEGCRTTVEPKTDKKKAA
jgi:hypothetical protein